VLKLLPLLFLGGCVAMRAPSMSDTALEENTRDWAEVYRMEIKIAVENEDLDAYNFFFEEYMKERIKQVKESNK